MLQPYAMCFLDRNKFPVLRTEFVALDDDAAISHALAFCSTHLVEIVQGERIIARIPKGTKGLGPVQRADPRSAERIL